MPAPTHVARVLDFVDLDGIEISHAEILADEENSD